MPWTYAHYRFGAQMLSAMPADLRRPATRFRQLYDVGLHGADIFQFSTPVIGRQFTDLAEKFHNQTGADYFQRVCRGLRLDPTEAAESYLYGALTHYCLDRACQGFMKEKADQGVASLQQIQTEFDRYLLEKDGKVPPCTQDFSPHIRLTPGECETAARFYTGVSAATVRDAVRNMAMATKLLATPEGARRNLLARSLKITGKNREDRVMGNQPNLLCSHLNGELEARYQQAAEEFPDLLLQLSAHLTYNAPLGEDFASIFG